MSTFAEKLAAKKAARPTGEVSVLLAADLAAERDRLLAIIEAPDPDPRLGSIPPAVAAREQLDVLEASAGESIITFRFTQLPGNQWAALTSMHPPRINVPIDESYGYNFDAATVAAARYVDAKGNRYGVRLEDGEEIPLLVTPASAGVKAVDEWDDLFDACSGHEVARIRNTIWGLNEYLPKVQLEAMGKAFGATARSTKN